MQFSKVFLGAISLLATGAAAAPKADVSPAKRQTDSEVNVFSGTGCNGFIENIVTSGLDPNNGDCFPFRVGQEVFSVDTTELTGGCTLTVYTDDSCSNDATAARVGECVSNGNGWGSFSTDNCS